MLEFNLGKVRGKHYNVNRLLYRALLAPPLFMAWITVNESPSKMTSCIPTSYANFTACLHDIASTYRTELGRGMHSDMVAITSPFLSLMITPTLAEWELLKTAPSKFALKCWELGGH